MNDAGFWLSFAAVLVLLFAVSSRPRARNGLRNLLIRWGYLQLSIVLGLMPLTLYLFGKAAFVSAAANIIAIPLVGLLIVPLVLSATLLSIWLPSIAGTLLAAADYLLAGFMQMLVYIEAWPFGQWARSQISLPVMLAAWVGVLLLWAPRGMPARWLGVCWVLPLFFLQQSAPAPGELHLTVLDVGQGTAVIAQTHQHLLVYDSGPGFNERFNGGVAAILPYLRYAGLDRIDTLVISHGDNDHIGGAGALLRALPVKRLLTSVPADFF